MNPQETRQAEELIFRIRDLGLAVVVIEHDMRFIFNLCDRVLCLVQGKRLIEGTPAEVQSDPRVIEAYIGDRTRRTSAELEAEPDEPTDTPASREAAMLEVKDLKVAYGRVRAVKGITFTVEEGQVVTLVGTNGAGKTTTLRTISGLLTAGGRGDLVRGQADRRHPGPRDPVARAGPLPGGPADLPAADGRGEPDARRVRPPGQGGDRQGPGPGLRPVPVLRSGGRSRPARSPAASSRCWPSAGRMMSRPKLLMLDEPSMGLSPIMMQKIMTTIVELQREGVTILLVEQNAQAALSLADYGYVLEVGKIVLQDTGKALLVRRERPQGVPRRGLTPVRGGIWPWDGGAWVGRASARSRPAHLASQAPLGTPTTP